MNSSQDWDLNWIPSSGVHARNHHHAITPNGVSSGKTGSVRSLTIGKFSQTKNLSLSHENRTLEHLVKICFLKVLNFEWETDPIPPPPKCNVVSYFDVHNEP